MNNKLIKKLPSDFKFDIVGDVHGEIDVLKELINQLGYDENGKHKSNRKLIFVGDLCDRGPDSIAVLTLIKKMIDSNNAFAILGNHEFNLLNGENKDGSGWFFKEQRKYDDSKYFPYSTLDDENKKKEIINFLNSLPLALYRDDIRIVHASWNEEAIKMIANNSDKNPKDLYQYFDKKFIEKLEHAPWYNDFINDKKYYYEHYRDLNFNMTFMKSICNYELLKNTSNPIKVITNGLEKSSNIPYFAAGRWRFTTRYPWWNDYDDKVPVVIGHYWRIFENKIKHKLFPERYNSWLGKHSNVFCIDFSIGALWKDRLKNKNYHNSIYKLAALRWPEKVLFFNDGSYCLTINYNL